MILKVDPKEGKAYASFTVSNGADRPVVKVCDYVIQSFYVAF